MSNFKNISLNYESIINNNLNVAEFQNIPYIFGTEKLNLSLNSIFSFRTNSINFQWTCVKNCSDWVSYFSVMSEIWSFFLIFYFFALFFFFYYIIPEALPVKRLSINMATPKSWFSSTIACGVPFVLIFSILYESVYMLFTNEVFQSKISPLFLVEGKQWKWEYRFNLIGVLEHTFFKKLIGSNVEVTSFKFLRYDVETIVNKINNLLGSDFFENSLRIKSEIMKSKKSESSISDLLFINELYFSKNYNLSSGVLSTVEDFFLKFRITECYRRVVTATKSISVPDFPIIKAYITGCDVIHSWTVPGLGIRIDAVPGKLYSIKIPFKYHGTFNGQCSEVCGLRHAYMPIAITFLPYEFFIKSIYIYIFFSFDFLFSKSKNLNTFI